MKHLLLFVVLIMVFIVGCRSSSPLAPPGCERGNCAYYGLQDFGFQYIGPSPYSEWLPPDGVRNAFRRAYTGPNGYLMFNFVPFEDVASIENAIYQIFGLNPDEYQVTSEEVLERNGRRVTQLHFTPYLETPALTERLQRGRQSRELELVPWTVPEQPLIRIAIFSFDEERWAVVHGASMPGRERRFNSAFDTILWSLEPFRLSPQVVVTVTPP